MLDKYLNAPIPGQSLTNEPGNVPWEQPPQMVDLDEVVRYYVERLSEPEGVDAVAGLLKSGTPAVAVAKTLMRFSVMKGIHSVDAGMLATPVIVELIRSIGEIEDIDYYILSEDERTPPPPSEDLVLEILNEVKEPMMEEAPTAPVGGFLKRRMKESE
jgi:hypothetical protein